MSSFFEAGSFIKAFLLPVLTLLIILFSFFILIRREFFIRRKTDDKAESQLSEKTKAAKYPASYRINYDISKFDEYHKECLRQSKVSFTYSILFAVFGFFVFIGTIILYADSKYLAGASVASATIEVVSGLFIVQTNRTRKLMLDFFDKLRLDRRLDQSLNLCDSIEDLTIKNTLKAKLSLFLLGMSNSPGLPQDYTQIDAGDNKKTE